MKKYDKKEAQQKSEEKRSEMYATIQNGANILLAQMQEGKSERLLTLLAWSSKFHRYSPNNQLLLLLQCIQRGIEASHVASYTTWKSMNYAVRKGEKGIGIYAPNPYRAKDEESGEEITRLSFRVAYVFADTQVEPMQEDMPALPTFFVPLEGDCDALSSRLADVVQSDNITLVEQVYGGAQGYSAKGRIGIKPGLDSTSRFLTLIHEYAHEILHRGSTLEKRVKECQAEATAYIVAHHFGVHNPYSADYLHGWGNDAKALLAELEVVQKTAASIIDKMEQLFLSETQGEAA